MRTDKLFSESENLIFNRKELESLNKHVGKNGAYSVLPTTRIVNPDGE